MRTPYRQLFISSLVVAASIALLSTAAAQSDTPADLAPGETGHFGAPFTDDSPPIPLAEAVQTCVDTGTACKVEATVAAVCARRGCWFTLEGDGVESSVRVRMQDYGFFVPRNTGGAQAIVEGTLERVTIPQDTAQHYADDQAAAGAAPVVVEGPQEAVEITATAVQMTLPPQ